MKAVWSIGSLALTLSLLGAVPAMSCSAGMTNSGLKPVKYHDDCSVGNLGKGLYGHGDAAAARDLGNGLSSQIVSAGPYGCTVVELLVVTECATRDTVVIGGATHSSVSDEPVNLVAGGFYAGVKYIMPPYGPIDLNADVTLEKLVALSEQFSLEYSRDRRVLWKEAKTKNFDTYCGCKLFYPDISGDAK